MSIFYSKYFLKRIQRRYREKPVLRTKVAIKGRRQDQYSFWIEGNLRMVYIQDGADVIFTDILTHDEY